ncbi:FimV/HubP family polar landmark protein [Caballeronia sp. BR00000012568055]|uniref:FimV/HubP family polar landmark protein n=1 Tax=Caballeronia sp. BR00000012568055 TaxID=2918761 RepID=UPI0023F793C1|nr:FimV/HubP family polar landmark protein [Caballeronia sp. BR00000012568055]
MIQRPVRSFLSSSRAVLVASSVALCAMCWAIPGDVFAQASAATAQTYAVKPGQSLNDVAGELTGSKDKDVRAKMARALFDANPNAFGGHDINKLKLGAVLNVPSMDAGGASAVEAAAPAAASTPDTAPTLASEPAQAALPASTGETAASSVQPEPASAPTVEPASTAVEAPAAPTPVPEPRAAGGMNPALIGVVALVLIVLAFLWKRSSGKKARAKARRAATADDDAHAPRTFATLEEAQAAAAARNEAVRQQKQRESQSDEAAILETKSVPRNDDSELNAVAGSMESYDAAQSFATPTEEDTPKAPEATPFVPATPAAPHAAFVPPPHEAPTRDDSAEREARKWETEEREAAARQAAAQEAEERENRERERAAREALARDLHARERQLLDAEAKQAVEEEKHAEEAREAAAREIIAREAELRQAQAAEQQASREPDAEDEASPAHRFPMPKFPQEAIQALDSLEFGLPPRMELTLNLPNGQVTSNHGAESAAPTLADAQPVAKAPLERAPSIDDEAPRSPYVGNESVAPQIEAGTAGAGAVAGLGATQFAPLSLDFDSRLPRSHTEPLPPMTHSQLAAIARNKLELAGEYIELGDLPGARTLLQEVIASNDPATRQRAATLLSTLAPHS